MEIPSEYTARSSARLSTKNAWALYARRRWPTNGVKLSMAEWGITEGEAKGLFAAQISQPTIDKILDHPRGDFRLGLLVLQIRLRTSLHQYIEHEKARLDVEAKRLEDDRAAADRVAARLRDLGDLHPSLGFGKAVRGLGEAVRGDREGADRDG